MAALSSYDQVLREDEQQNRMVENMELFDEICNCTHFQKKDVILFLNKSDLFKEKIVTKDLAACFPEYRGGRNYDIALEYVQNKFKALNKSPHQMCEGWWGAAAVRKEGEAMLLSSRHLTVPPPSYVHVTCALDTDNMKFVLASVRKTLLKDALGVLGMRA